jgi:peptidoglycan/xylan/chitin deacetylase (PgdA/CDA1 family)
MTFRVTGRRWLKILASRVSRVLPPAPGLWVFLFHSVGRGEIDAIETRRMELAPEDFSDSLAWIQRRFRIVSCSEAALRIRTGDVRGRLAVVTFDDAYRSVSEHAFPELKRLGAPFTLFVNSAMIEEGEVMWRNRVVYLQRRFAGSLAPETARFLLEAKTRFAFPETLEGIERVWRRYVSEEEERSLAKSLYLSWEELEAMQAGHTAELAIGNHTAHHWILSRLPEAMVRDEIARCDDALVARFPRRSPFLAIPHGAWAHTSERVQALIAEAGYTPLLGTGGWYALQDAPPNQLDPVHRVAVSVRRPAWLAVAEQRWLRLRKAGVR